MTTIYSDNAIQSTDRQINEEPEQPTGRCKITRCGGAANQIITHPDPDQGSMPVCTLHARRIRALDTSRFHGGASD